MVSGLHVFKNNSSIYKIELTSDDNRDGFSLLETVVALGILSLIILAVGIFQGNVFGLNVSLSSQLTGQDEARRALEQFSAELREAATGGNGAFAIESAGATGITFYTNADSDAGIERVRYFLSGASLQRGVVEPGGNPVVYNTATETVATVVSNIANGAQALFEYYDASYDGTGSALAQPVNASSVRYVKLVMIIDRDPLRPPAPFRSEGGASVRNLKDNL